MGRWDAARAKKRRDPQLVDPPHTCHAEGCETTVPPKLLMCGRHWRMVPRPVQMLVWNAYVPGQEITKCPTPAYLEAAQTAVDLVRTIEANRPMAQGVQLDLFGGGRNGR